LFIKNCILVANTNFATDIKMRKQILLLAAITLLSIFAMTIIWEFLLESVVNDIFGVDDFESDKDHWEYVITSIIFAGIALIAPIAIALKTDIHRQRAEKQVKMLSGLLPICSHCKKIRTVDSDWKQIEIYIREHSEAEFSHSICPDCLKEHYSEEFL